MAKAKFTLETSVDHQAQKTQARETINDLLVGASNLKIANDICGRMPKNDEFTELSATFKREMIERLREAAKLIAETKPAA